MKAVCLVNSLYTAPSTLLATAILSQPHATLMKSMLQLSKQLTPPLSVHTAGLRQAGEDRILLALKRTG